MHLPLSIPSLTTPRRYITPRANLATFSPPITVRRFGRLAAYHAGPAGHSRPPLQPIGRAQYPVTAAVKHVGVNHGRPDIGVAEQFLHGADVVAVAEQVRGERMPQGIVILPMNRPSPQSATDTTRSAART